MAVCPECGVACGTPAETFLHQQVHREPWGTPHGLGKLPFAMMPRIARLLEDYRDASVVELQNQLLDKDRLIISQAARIDAQAELLRQRAERVPPGQEQSPALRR